MLEAARRQLLPLSRELPENMVAPAWFANVLRGDYVPTLTEALRDLPFVNLCEFATPSPSTSVLHISDIPYATTRQEMIAFVGQQAQILRMPARSAYYAVHIIMDRESGKTMDCFIELATVKEASMVLKTMQSRADSGRPPKVNNRLVTVKVSSQEELMSELFPRARHVAWHGNHPVVDTKPRQYYPGVNAVGFQGFIQDEEMVDMIKIAEMGHRALFASKNPTRVYETMISILHKYPWHAIDVTTLRERRALFDLSDRILNCLVAAVHVAQKGNLAAPRTDGLPPTDALVEELIIAILGCPGFNEKQKATIVHKMNAMGYERMTKGRIGLITGGRDPLSNIWPFQVYSPCPGADPDVVRFYASLIRDATLSHNEHYYGDRRLDSGPGMQYKPLGNFQVNYGNDAESLTVAQAARIELQHFGQVLASVLANT